MTHTTSRLRSNLPSPSTSLDRPTIPMSSTLAVHHDPQNFDLARLHSTTSRCSGDELLHTTNSSEPGIPSWFRGGLPTPPGTKDMTVVSLTGSYGTHPQAQLYNNNLNNTQLPQPFRTHSRIPSDPYINPKQSIPRSSTLSYGSTEKSRGNLIAAHLQIPESINKSKGSLAEFAAEITCLFWFETAATLEYAEGLPTDSPSDRGLVTDAFPGFGFKKWVTTILSTTQVGKNVILLALMFIYRLKKFNPSVSGKRGSEFRLLTIALMLGNKFLDDNTYTNKTWAEVSGISVTEIHIMEVEFLSNMRYELYASEADWARWKALLGKFGSFYDKAVKFRQQRDELPANPPTSPTSFTLGYKLPSPPSGHLNPIGSMGYTSLPNPMSTLPTLPRSPVRQYLSNLVPSERKRSLDPSETLPPAKRHHFSNNPSNVPSPTALTPSPGAQSDYSQASISSNHVSSLSGSRIPQLPMPRLPPAMTGPAPQLAPLTLPTTRAMASVYPPHTTAAWSQPVTPISAIPPSLNNQYSSGITPIPEGVRSNVGSAHTSPINMFGASTPTRQGLSPSYFLTNRSSPYRPVRNVNTLLIPPPSGAMQNITRTIGYDQMHYQPLGRPSETRSGPVPYYHPEGWNHSNVSTPVATSYRAF